MHDIGNPPFGHSGEKAIGEYFKTGKGLQHKASLSAEEYQDLIDFEGNANGLKILTENIHIFYLLCVLSVFLVETLLGIL